MKLLALKPWLLLRTAAVVALLLGVGHSLGAPWTPVVGPAERAVIDAMKADQFAVMGDTRSYWNFYIGFGWSISAYLVAQAIVLWQLAAQSKRDPRGVRSIVIVFLACTVLTAHIAWKYIVAVPVMFCAALAVLLALGVWACGRSVGETA